MNYLIDGYNLLFRISSVLDDFSENRDSIIQDLDKKAALLKMSLIIVFDAHESPGHACRTHYNHLEILYSGEGEIADDLILKVLKRAGKCANYTVVTNDKRLAWKARHLGAKTKSVDAFLMKLSKQQLKGERNEAIEKIAPKKKVKKLNTLEENDLNRWLRIFEERLRNL